MPNISLPVYKFKYEDARSLTKLEHKILALVCEGKVNHEIACELRCTIDAIKCRLHKIYDKIGMSSRLEAALWYETNRNNFCPFDEKNNTDDINSIADAKAACKS